VFAGIGWKHGRWHDVGWYQLQLHNPHDAPPPRGWAVHQVQRTW
jgi:hypothetical protein